MKQLINVKANLFVTSNQLGWNANCYDESGCNGCNDEAGLKSCFNKAGRNSCYNEAGHIGILLRILPTADTREDKLTTLINTVAYHSNNNSILNNTLPFILTYFMLYCTSLNLPTDMRIPPDYKDIKQRSAVWLSMLHIETEDNNHRLLA